MLSGLGCLPGWNAWLANSCGPPGPHGAIPEMSGFSQLQSMSRSLSESRSRPLKTPLPYGKKYLPAAILGRFGLVLARGKAVKHFLSIYPLALSFFSGMLRKSVLTAHRRKLPCKSHFVLT